MMIDTLFRRKPAMPWSHGGKIPWNDPGFSTRMLREHLSQENDRASRRSNIITEQVAWIHERVLAGHAGRVLDLGCGPGLYTSQLASRGHTCVGIDFSPASIEYAIQVARGQELPCRYELADLEDTPLGGPYDAALLLFGELNTFPLPVARGLLTRVRTALAPEGRVVLEVHAEEAVRSRGAEPPSWATYASSVFADGPHLALRECSWHEADSAAVERYFVFRSGAEEPDVFASTTQAYTSETYAETLREAGLVELDRFPCLTGRETGLDPSLFVIVAGVSDAT